MPNDLTVSHSYVKKVFKNIGISTNNKLIFGLLNTVNINSLRNNCDHLKADSRLG